MQTRETPPVIVDPDVERLIRGDMLDIREFVLSRAVFVGDRIGVTVDQIRIRQLYCYEEDWSKVIFEMCVSADERQAMAYWEAVDDTIWNERDILSEAAQTVLDNEVTVFVRW